MNGPLEALKRGAIVLVPNQRSEQYWSVCWLKESQSQALPGNRLYSLSRWLRELWLAHPNSFAQRLLSDREAQCWWAAHLSHDSPIPDYVPQAYGAWQRCARWHATAETLMAWPLNGPQKIFAQDLVICSQKRQEQGILFPDDLLAQASDLEWLQGLPQPQRPLFFHGFDDWPPAYVTVIEALEQWGVVVEHAPPPASVSIQQQPIRATYYPSEEAERQAALQWLKDQPLQHRSAVIVPDMSRDFELIKQQIHTQFEGEHAYLPLEQQRPWLAISAGISLNKVSLIAKLLAALQEQPYQQGGGISEEKWPQYGQVLPAVGLWDQHLKALSVALEELQWLHDIRLSSEEYQAAHTLSNSITTLQGLCSDLPPITAARFITLWELNLSLTVFQPQSLTDKKMVLGLLEAAALPWDAVWITKACFEHFPPPLNPHPLLPYDWQVQGQLPQAHPGREWAYFQKLLQRLILTVSDKTISQGTPDPLSAAPLWQMWDLLPAERGPELFFEKKQLRLRPEFFQPQAVSYPGKTLTVSQMNALSQCPFKGWALSLPQARPVQPAHPVFDPRIWGQITHIWVQQYLQLGKSDLRGNPNFRQWPLPLQHYAQKILTAATAQIAEKTPWQNERDILKIEQAFRWELTPELALEGRADLLWESCRVVDIKTSTPILSHWFNESPKDWQGAIYALALGVPALGLLRISASGMQYWEKDVSDRSALWEEQLLALAQRWEAGLYHPSPIDKATCAHCPFQASCRYHLEEIASCL